MLYDTYVLCTFVFEFREPRFISADKTAPMERTEPFCALIVCANVQCSVTLTFPYLDKTMESGSTLKDY